MKLVLFAHTPPPHHGQSFMVEQLLRQLRGQKHSSSAFQDFQVFHVNARLSDEIDQIGHWRMGKLFRIIRYVAEAIWCRLRFGATAMLYIPAPGVRAAIYRDWMIVGVCRFFFPDLIYYWQAAGLAEWMRTGALWWERRISERLLRCPALSIILGESNRRDAEWALSRQVIVIPNGIPDPCPDYAGCLEAARISRATARMESIDGRIGGAQQVRSPFVFHVLFIGLCCAEKGLFDAMDAVVLVNGDFVADGMPIRIKLSIAGEFFSEVDRKQFDQRMSQTKFADAVQYFGFVSGDTKRRLFAEHDCLIFPTYYLAESFGIVLIEAMAYGMSIVATHWRSIPEVLPPNYEGLVEPRNIHALARALEHAVRSPYDATLRRRFLENYTIERHAGNVKEAILRCASNASEPAAMSPLVTSRSKRPLSLTYSLADQDFARTKSIGIYNVSVHLARSLAAEPRLGEMTVLANATVLDDLSLRRIEKVEIRDCAARTPLQRILWDQWNVYSEAKRVGNEWLLLPKGFASFVRPPPVRLAAYVHDMMNQVYATEYAGQVSLLENFYFRQAMVATLRNAELILTNSEFTASEVRRVAKIYDLVAPRVVCVGVGFQRPDAVNPIRENRIIALTSRWPHKRADLAVTWLQRWQDETGFAGTIHLIGSLPKNVRYPVRAGWLHAERLPEVDYRELLQSARMMVYFSDHEGFGMPPVEAALAGACPVYSSLVPTREAMGGAGLPFSNADFKSFRNAMNDALLVSPEVIAGWADKLLARHQWSRVAERVVTALHEADRS
jgi:glycosyltransferase involved in cell wall biosynthesis